MGRAYEKRPAEQIALIRRSVQIALLLLNLWIGVRFYFWVRFFETGGQSLYVPRPAKVRDWVVLYVEDGAGEYQCTVITVGHGPLRGRRIVAGRENERGSPGPSRTAGTPASHSADATAAGTTDRRTPPR